LELADIERLHGVGGSEAAVYTNRRQRHAPSRTKIVYEPKSIASTR